MVVRKLACGGVAVGLALAAWAPSALAGHGLNVASHGLDHPVPPFAPPAPPSLTFNAGGEGAEWKVIDTIATGNPHTDIDFFTRGGETYMAAGTLGIGPNAGGQTIVRLTDGGTVAPELVSSQPSASCLSDPSAALGLQHDVEATPKGGAPLNIRNPFAARSDARLLLDATDAPGRCHDQGVLGLADAPQGGLEIIDVTNPAAPVEIGLTSHIGEAHTVNVDPKRPHIAYAVTSDAVGLDAEGNRDNVTEGSLELDGFEVVDFRTCLRATSRSSLAGKRDGCRPKVYRYRFPNKRMALGHTVKEGGAAIFGCHELEVYPSDLLTCASGNALVGLDMSRAFHDRGTPRNFRDDRPRGKPLPCRLRASTSLAPFATAAMITDCVDGRGAGATDLAIGEWLAGGAPSLKGVRWLGSVYHQGGGPQQADTPFPSGEEIAFDHEAELSPSGRFLFATDERGGGVLPPGAACTPGLDNPDGNGGIHAFRLTKLSRTSPKSAQEAQRAYARAPSGDRAIFRTPIQTGPQATFCTSHVLQQIPGQNRIFMGWYSQGTQVLDYRETRKGRIKFQRAGYLIPENANTWVSHVFDWQRNANGTFTYRGATGDFNLGAAGRSAIDIFEVTLPPPPKPKRPTRRVCRKHWDQVHRASGRPFASRAGCLRYARRR